MADDPVITDEKKEVEVPENAAKTAPSGSTQQKKMKEAKAFRESLKKGNKVVTIGGIHGKIESVKDNAVILIVEDGNKIKIEKSAISSESSSNETELAQRKK